MAFYEWHFKNHLPNFFANPTVGSIILFNLFDSTPVKLKIWPTEPPKGLDSTAFKLPASV